MRMNRDFAKKAQWFFELLMLDNMSAIYILNGKNEIDDWQFSVDFIYRILTCKLAKLCSGFSEVDNNEFLDNEIAEYCQELATYNPLDNAEIPWIGCDISLTEYGVNVFHRCFSNNYNLGNEEICLNYLFIETLERIFTDYNVPWDEKKFLIPIKY